VHLSQDPVLAEADDDYSYKDPAVTANRFPPVCRVEDALETVQDPIERGSQAVGHRRATQVDVLGVDGSAVAAAASYTFTNVTGRKMPMSRCR
jgi:hypothetical protein